ncbi:lipid A core-O-antigen ligase-like enyme [Aequorivita sublithincola DSM 14238]|uniref:Lipid A core-O-antigen ligase-like enyme n=1 Tax=Aequorivita sublithincola (strain DSM 14238 / LMG 21431 / ACAM 643 / 9-3) TaxID=746697 RepID=I3YUM4_AEQSU|nr:O-antigen ligase family protein [Aequorivita sublithincola]AFL80692.1 lipid A core-O-antigen ligase-like enyme [Aequorivita sublithincola DSM 14238]
MRILLSAIYPYAFLLLYLIIPFDEYFRAPPNILLAILVVAFPFVVKKEDFKKLKSIPIAIFLALFAYLFIDSFLAGRLEEDYKFINKVMIAVGLAILYIPVADVKKINSAIIFSALAAILFSIYNFVLITDATGSFALGDSPQVVESLLVDRLYLGLLSTFSILISFQAIQKKYHPNNNYYLANIFINFVFIVLIASKIAVISLFVLVLIHQFYGQRKIWKLIIAFVALTAVVGLFLILKNEKGSQLYKAEVANQNAPPAFIQNSMTYELRAVVWKCATDIINDEGFNLTGIGFTETKNKLVSCYETKIEDPKKSEEFVTERYNTHSQFLDFYLSAGFIGLLLFLLFIVVSFFTVKKQFFPTAMLAILVMYCLVENVFHRQIGAYYIGFILIVLITSAQNSENNRIKDI